MATTTSLTQTYAGELASEILRPALLGFSSKDYVTVKENIPYKAVVRKAVDTVSFANATCDFTPTGTITLTERTLTLKALQLHQNLCKKDFFPDWTAADAQDGRMNEALLSAILANITEGSAAKMETLLWQGVTGNAGEFDGLGTLIDADADNDINFVASPAALTTSNIIAKIELLLAAIPTAVENSTEKPLIYMNRKTYHLFRQANNALGFGGASWVYNAPAIQPNFNGIYDIAVCPGIADNTMYAAQKSNLWFGTWLNNQMNDVTLKDMAEFGEQNVRLAMNFFAGAQYGIGAEIAAYGPGLS